MASYSNSLSPGDARSYSFWATVSAVLAALDVPMMLDESYNPQLQAKFLILGGQTLDELPVLDAAHVYILVGVEQCDAVTDAKYDMIDPTFVHTLQEGDDFPMIAKRVYSTSPNGVLLVRYYLATITPIPKPWN